MKKNNWLFLIIILVALSAVYLGLKTDFFALKTKENSSSVFIKAIHETDKSFNVQAEYPQFENIEEDFNKKISDFVINRIAEFKNDSLENWQARKATALPEDMFSEYPETPFDFIAEWEPAQINEKYISFVVRLYYFTGGAHGFNEIKSFNYDIQNQKEITITEFLNNSDEALNNLSELAELDLSMQFQGNGVKVDGILAQMMGEGTKPIPNNYENFTFNYNSLVIHFQQYQVAPGAYGMPMSIFYKADLEANSIFSDYWR
ncbi:DUF3298 and DUF4163 domain-containing protein [Candidatus Wolfebacteria bacterium]|nr:DUF3298 and DUF4163 domain-containing protein [Candidatus Wolfebacteria bacterium]